MSGERAPTAVAISTLDMSALGLADDPAAHWGVPHFHFLLVGHHKLEAAVTASRPARLL
ncbi:hypothetical protein [Streptomyces sp. SID8364]|uniref:hypothetical protein n=1 Tax=unclassified Streptomyces TaxID=2593676 RepID=UPI00159F2E4C